MSSWDLFNSWSLGKAKARLRGPEDKKGLLLTHHGAIPDLGLVPGLSLTALASGKADLLVSPGGISPTPVLQNVRII